MNPSTNDQEHNGLSSLAKAMTSRSQEIRTDKAKDRALELARLVLEGAPGFGAAELRDPEIIKDLESEGIGLATFRKALSVARKELVKPPKSSSKRRKSNSRTAKKASPSDGGLGEQQDLLGSSTAMKNVPRGKL